MNTRRVGLHVVRQRRPNDAASPGTPGRSPEFRRYLAELAIADPARHAEITRAESAYVPELVPRLKHAESILEESMEGYEVIPGGDG